jgi:hypothetical protein
MDFWSRLKGGNVPKGAWVTTIYNLKQSEVNHRSDEVVEILDLAEGMDDRTLVWLHVERGWDFVKVGGRVRLDEARYHETSVGEDLAF